MGDMGLSVKESGMVPGLITGWVRDEGVGVP